MLSLRGYGPVLTSTITKRLPMLLLLEKLGAYVLRFLAYLGHLGLFLGYTLGLVFIPPLKIHRIIRQLHFIGARSSLVIALTGVFAGMVLSLQGYYTLSRFGSTAFLGSAVAISLITELGPVLSALMVTGRAGSTPWK
jgi:phospholipid/cholesterol/gamma-HCH transport system permease protein